MDAENRSEQQKNFDQWLDAALRARIDAEPRMGMEQRVLARLASEPRRARITWWPVFVAVTALLAIAVGIAFLRTSNAVPTIAAHRDQAHSSPLVNRPPTVQAESMPRVRVAERAASRPSVKTTHCCTAKSSFPRVRRSEPLPKLATFPMARPETEQERLLSRLVAQGDSVQIASLKLDSPIRELSVPELNIAPIEGVPPDDSPQH